MGVYRIEIGMEGSNENGYDEGYICKDFAEACDTAEVIIKEKNLMLASAYPEWSNRTIIHLSTYCRWGKGWEQYYCWVSEVTEGYKHYKLPQKPRMRVDKCHSQKAMTSDGCHKT